MRQPWFSSSSSRRIQALTSQPVSAHEGGYKFYVECLYSQVREGWSTTAYYKRVTNQPHEGAAEATVAAGAAGYVPKEEDRERLLAALRAVMMGELRLPSEVVRRVFAENRNSARMEDVGGLTPREREILISCARGTSYARIAVERKVHRWRFGMP